MLVTLNSEGHVVGFSSGCLLSCCLPLRGSCVWKGRAGARVGETGDKGRLDRQWDGQPVLGTRRPPILGAEGRQVGPLVTAAFKA